MFSSQFFIRNYQSKLPSSKELAVSTNVTSRTGPIHIQTLILSYQHVLTLLYKPNATLLLMPLRVKMMKHHLDKNKAPTIVLIRMSTIMMISGHLRHIRGGCYSYYFDDTIATTTTLQSSTLPPPGK